MSGRRRFAASLPAAAAIVVVSVFAACAGSNDDWVACTEEARASVMVSVVDAVGSPLAGAVVTYLVNGVQPGTAECADPSTPAAQCSLFVAGYELAGAFEIAATRGGYRTARANVEVPMDEAGCHVVTRQVTLQLFPG